MKYLVLFISLLIGHAFAADTVRLQDPTNFPVSGVTNMSISLNVDTPSGDATAEAAPARVYLPLTSNYASNHDKYFTQNGATVNLFDVGSTTHTVTVPVTISTLNTMYLYVAAKVSTATGYKIVQQYPNSVTGSSTNISDFGIIPKKICDQYDCSTVASTGQSSPSKVTFTLYYFLSSTGGQALGGPIDPSTTPGGIFVEMQMSNRVYQMTDLRTYITGTKKGDGRAILSYTSDASILDFKKVIVFQHQTTPTQDNQPIGSYTGGSIVNINFPAMPSSDITVSGLQNNTPYIFSVAFVDNFGFATTLSATTTVTPVQIQELLKKQACYILTAGFGEEHYITNYFRSYRDHVLAHSWLGRRFIHFYYGTAPHYALIIYKSEKLRFMVRMFAYSLYFILNYGWVVLIFLGSCFFLNFLRKNKILLQNNRL